MKATFTLSDKRNLWDMMEFATLPLFFAAILLIAILEKYSGVYAPLYWVLGAGALSAFAGVANAKRDVKPLRFYDHVLVPLFYTLVIAMLVEALVATGNSTGAMMFASTAMFFRMLLCWDVIDASSKKPR